MLFTRFYDDDLAQASYFIGCQQVGQAVIVDPRRDVAVYENEADARDMRIVAVTETHVHADYLSGARELAARTGARLLLSAMGAPDWQYRFDHEPLSHGGRIEVGNVRLEALYTPGHTPEHLMFLLSDRRAADFASIAMTGDFVFVGDVGRPDLLDLSGGGKDTRRPMAQELFRSLQTRFWPLPDYLQVWPGHGAGSACGKSLGALPATTAGYEKLVSWWSHFVKREDEAGFVDALLAGQPDAPSYFARMKRLNRDGPPLLGERGTLPKLTGKALRKHLDGGRFIDTRPREAYARGSHPRAIHLPAGTTFATWAAWLIDPEANGPLILLARDEAEAGRLRDKLSRVGIDDVVGYVSELPSEHVTVQPRARPQDVEALERPLLLDVRTTSEHGSGHIPGSVNVHAGQLVDHLDDLPRDRPIVAYCQSGNRSAAAASLLRSKGFESVYDLDGGYSAWTSARGPVNKLKGA